MVGLDFQGVGCCAPIVLELRADGGGMLCALLGLLMLMGFTIVGDPPS